MSSDRSCTIGSLLRRIVPYKKELILGQLAVLGATVLTVLTPLLVPILVDELLLGKSHGFTDWISTHLFRSDTKGYVLFVLALLLVMRLGSTALAIVQSKFFVSISKNIAYTLRTQLLEHLQRVSFKSYETMHSGAIASKLVSDIETIDSFIGASVSKLIVSSLVLLFSAVVLLWIHWPLALFILLTNPFVVLVTVKLSRKVGRLKREENGAIERFQSLLVETLELLPQIKAANSETRFFGEVDKEASRLKDRSFAFGYKSDASMRLSYFVFLSGYEIFRAASILAVAYSDLSVGLMLAIFSYLWVMVAPTQDLINFQYTLATAKAACRRIEDLMQLPVEPDYPTRCDPFTDRNAVALYLDEVGFAYREDKPILRQVSMRIDAGSKVAIVGPSGSGKTTLAHLIVGFYEPDSGTIRYGQCDQKAIGLRTIRDHVHMILQHPKLFNATMRFNLTLGKPFDEARIREALRIAQLEEVVARLDQGLDTPVGKEGVRLSGGERQRVAIARMVLADPKIIVLDESTSALDVRTEAKLFAALEAFWQDKTVIVIAHRLSTIEKAQYVYVLESGRITQEGTPERLRGEAEGYFAAML